MNETCNTDSKIKSDPMDQERAIAETLAALGQQLPSPKVELPAPGEDNSAGLQQQQQQWRPKPFIKWAAEEYATGSSNQIQSKEFGEHDVLSGRSREVRQFIGNVRFRALIDENRPAYKKAGRKLEKTRIASKIFEIIKSRGGRFLDSHPGQPESWFELSNEKALGKVSQTLRKGAKHMKHPNPKRKNTKNTMGQTLNQISAAALTPTAGGLQTLASPAMPPRLQNSPSTVNQHSQNHPHSLSNLVQKKYSTHALNSTSKLFPKQAPHEIQKSTHYPGSSFHSTTDHSPPPAPQRTSSPAPHPPPFTRNSLSEPTSGRDTPSSHGSSSSEVTSWDEGENPALNRDAVAPQSKQDDKPPKEIHATAAAKEPEKEKEEEVSAEDLLAKATSTAATAGIPVPAIQIFPPNFVQMQYPGLSSALFGQPAFMGLHGASALCQSPVLAPQNAALGGLSPSLWHTLLQQEQQGTNLGCLPAASLPPQGVPDSTAAPQQEPPPQPPVPLAYLAIPPSQLAGTAFASIAATQTPSLALIVGSLGKCCNCGARAVPQLLPQHQKPQQQPHRNEAHQNPGAANAGTLAAKKSGEPSGMREEQEEEGPSPVTSSDSSNPNAPQPSLTLGMPPPHMPYNNEAKEKEDFQKEEKIPRRQQMLKEDRRPMLF